MGKQRSSVDKVSRAIPCLPSVSTAILDEIQVPLLQKDIHAEDECRYGGKEANKITSNCDCTPLSVNQGSLHKFSEVLLPDGEVLSAVFVTEPFAFRMYILRGYIEVLAHSSFDRIPTWQSRYLIVTRSKLCFFSTSETVQ